MLLVCPNWLTQYWFPMIQICRSKSHGYIRFANSKGLLGLPFLTSHVDMGGGMNFTFVVFTHFGLSLRLSDRVTRIMSASFSVSTIGQ